MRIGVDVGGTKVEAALLDREGVLRLRRRIPTPQHYETAVGAIADLVLEVEAESETACRVGVGIPGTLSPATGLVKNAYNSPFNGHPLDRDLGDRLGRPIRMMNDANCFALSEARGGAAEGARIVFGAILGTGCGSGVVVDGSALVGRNAIAGEWGHNPLPWAAADERPGPPCSCGKLGCNETFLSGTGFAADHRRTTGQDLDAAEITARADAGDAACLASLERYEDRLARALAAIINVIDPHVIVLGGGMSNVSRLYARVPAIWGRWVFSDRVDTALVPPAFGDSSGVRGAAWQWPDEG